MLLPVFGRGLACIIDGATTNNLGQRIILYYVDTFRLLFPTLSVINLSSSPKLPNVFNQTFDIIIMNDPRSHAKMVENRVKIPLIRSAAPNNMEYEDDNGVYHSIYLPQGTMHTAWEHLQNKRWDELAKFAAYSKFQPAVLAFLLHLY